MKSPMTEMLNWLIKNPEASYAERVTKCIELKSAEKKHIMLAASRTFPELIREEIGEEYYNGLYPDLFLLEAQAKTNTNDMSPNDEPSAP